MAVHGLFAALPAQLARLKEGEQEKEKSYVAVCWLPRPLTDADVAAIAGARGLEVQQQTPVRVSGAARQRPLGLRGAVQLSLGSQWPRRQKRRRLASVVPHAAVSPGEKAAGGEPRASFPPQVLHRRANLERPRTVHEMAVQRLAGPPDGRGSYFALRLRTQAGTYIKEFVHGEEVPLRRQPLLPGSTLLAPRSHAHARSQACTSLPPPLTPLVCHCTGDLGRTRPSLGDLLGGCRAQIVSLDVEQVHMDFGPQRQ